jgi:hypothetical protein
VSSLDLPVSRQGSQTFVTVPVGELVALLSDQAALLSSQ